MFFVQTNHTRKELLFLMFKEINLRNHSSLHKLFYSLGNLLFQLLSTLQQISEFDWKDVLKSIQGINVLGNGISFKSVEDFGIINYSEVLKHILSKLKKEVFLFLLG